MDNEFILEAEGFGCWYQKKDRKILSDISFQMKRGEVLGLVGESGCGKTTLSRGILGMLENTEGSIRLETKQPQMVFQDPYSSLNPAKRIGWIMEEPLRLKKQLEKEERKTRVLEMMDQTGLDRGLINHYPGQLSGGQRQRVSIGTALLTGASFLIADEPVSALDVTVQAQILQLISDLQRKLDLSVLFISHDLNVIYQICDRVMVMQQGKILEIGETEAFFAGPKTAYAKQLLDATMDI